MSVEYVTNVGFGLAVVGDDVVAVVVSSSAAAAAAVVVVMVAAAFPEDVLDKDTDFFICMNNVSARRNSPASPNVASAVIIIGW